MCEPIGRARGVPAAIALPAAALLAVTLLARPCASQSAAQYRARLVAAARRTEVLRDSVRLIHAMRSSDLPADSLVVGELSFRFVAANLGSGLQGLLRSAAERSMRIADTMLGDDLHAVAGTAPILVTRGRTRIGGFAGADQVTLELANGNGRTTTVRAPVTGARLEAGILDLLGTMATGRVPSQVLTWGGAWVPSRRLSREDWEGSAIDLASSNSIVARTCYSGSVPACESALGLTAVTDPLSEWYSPDGWRVLVASWKPRKDSLLTIADRAQCLEKNVSEVCERLARSRPVPIPLTIATRQTLVGFALERGGRSAYSRLVHASGTPLQALATAAGVSADSLIRGWRSRSLSAAPESAGPSPGEAAVFVAFALAFGLAAGLRRP